MVVTINRIYRYGAYELRLTKEFTFEFFALGMEIYDTEGGQPIHIRTQTPEGSNDRATFYRYGLEYVLDYVRIIRRPDLISSYEVRGWVISHLNAGWKCVTSEADIKLFSTFFAP